MTPAEIHAGPASPTHEPKRLYRLIEPVYDDLPTGDLADFFRLALERTGERFGEECGVAATLLARREGARWKAVAGSDEDLLERLQKLSRAEHEIFLAEKTAFWKAPFPTAIWLLGSPLRVAGPAAPDAAAGRGTGAAAPDGPARHPAPRRRVGLDQHPRPGPRDPDEPPARSAPDPPRFRPGGALGFGRRRRRRRLRRDPAGARRRGPDDRPMPRVTACRRPSRRATSSWAFAWEPPVTSRSTPRSSA